MNETARFDEAVKEDIEKILSHKYNTVRRGGHRLDADENLHERPFWPDMRFERVELAAAPGGSQLRIRFAPASETGAVYGYKVDIDKAANAWSERIPIHEPRENPSMFAAELIWYMIASIGSVDLATFPEGEGGVRWINDGSEVFQSLPGTDEHV